jgi:hypothetical protein
MCMMKFLDEVMFVEIQLLLHVIRALSQNLLF